MDTIRRQVNEIGYLVDEFSNFARLPEPKFENTNITKIIYNIIKDYKSNYKNINFEIKFKDVNENLNLDKSQITRVFQNLIINSIHSIIEKGNSSGSIFIELYAENNSLYVK